MKKHYLLIILYLSFTTLFSQAIQKERKIVQVMSPQTFYLNGGTRAAFGGKSRAWYNIQLPLNTVEWYYSFTTKRGESAKGIINLFSQLTRLYDSTGMTALAANAIMTPTGAGVCDIYLMDRKNTDAFYDKVDNWGGTYSYKVSGSRVNFKDGTVQIKDITSGNWCLGFKNPSASEGISITFEVVAIVEQIKQQTDEQSQAFTLGNLGWKAFERGDYDRCLELSNEALRLDNTLGFVDFNIALCYLVKGRTTEAITEYAKAISLTRKTSIAKQTFEGARNDLNQYMFLFPSKDDAKDVLELINQELRNY